MISPAQAPLRDAAAREEFITALDENFCVSAGAGVGKTRAITDRIAALASQRAQQPDILSRLVVVTYGKLAAEELRVRTRERLLTRLGDSTAYGRQQLLGELRGAFFGTIHSFCLKLIAEHGRFLGLPAAPELLEGRALDALWAKFCDSEQLLALALPRELLRQVERHLTFEQLLALAWEIDPAEIEPLLETEAALNDGLAPLPDFSAALADSGGKNSKGRLSTAAHQARLRRWCEELQATEMGAAPRYLKLPEFKTGSATFKTAFADGLRPYARWLNAAAGKLAALLAQAWRSYRLDQGAMTYRDQIYWARQLLNRPATLRALRERRYVVILDEAQDTDAEMFAVLSEVTRPLDAALGTWPRQEDAPGPLPGRFSFVGDEQQAIYRERADPEIYAQYVQAFREGRGGRRLEFSVTMRCPARVLGVVNALFADGRLPQPHVEFRALHPRPACPDGGAWLLPLEDAAPAANEENGDRVSTAERVASECAQVADFLVARGKTGLSITRWDEVAILAPRIAWLEAAAAACVERGLPVNLISQNRIARELPVFSWPTALLHVLVNPWDRFELIGVLREIFAVSDVELARLHRRTEGGLTFWPQLPEDALAAAPKRLRDALTLLHELRKVMPGEKDAPTAGMTTLGRYVELLLERTALEARLEIIGCEDARVALDWLRREALQAECDGRPLRVWVRRLVESLEAPPPTLGAGAESIQLLTCQKAKGLEWPVVIPLGFGCAIKERSPEYPRLERGLGPCARIHFSSLTLEKTDTDARELRRREELQRFLYVTLTRARQLLIVPDGSRLHGDLETSFQSLARWSELGADDALAALLSPAAEAVVSADEAETKRSKPTTTEAPATVEPDPKIEALAAEISQRIPKRILPSSLAHGAASDAAVPEAVRVFDDDDLQRLLAADAAALEDTGATSDDASQALAAVAGTSGIFPPRALLGGRGGKDYGNWWHETLETYPWTNDAPNARATHLLERLAQIPAGETELSARADFELKRFAASRAHAEFLHAGKVFLPEAPFSYPRNADEWLEGILDLAIITQTGDVWIVDWKTDRRRQDETEAQLLARLAEKYGPQLRAYAEVFERGVGRRVSRLLLYSTPLGQVAEL